MAGRSTAPPALAQTLRLPLAGRPLPEAVRARMESALHHDFAHVRIHEDARPGSIGARAVARGNHIHFNLGEYQPETEDGQRVLAHELAHVVQQRQGRVRAHGAEGVPIASEPRLEAEADRAASTLNTSAQAVSAPAASPDYSPPVPVAQPMLAARRGPSLRTIFGGGGGGWRPPRQPWTPPRGHYLDAPPLLPNIQKRYIHVGMQGSGVSRDDDSTVKAMGESYQGPSSLLIGGPGKSSHDPVEWPFMGALQTESGQDERVREAMRAIAEAHRAGDRSIHLSGHSRGAGNALLLAQIIHRHGVVHPDTGEQFAPPGTPIHSLTLFDAVPHMSGAGHATGLDDSGEQANVPYEQLQAPPNVEFYQHFFAGGERRDQFRQADIPSSSADADSVHSIIPQARHNEVGGKPGGNPDAIALALSEALRNLRARRMPFADAGILEDSEHNEALQRLRESTPQPGPVEQLIAAVGGEGARQFPHYAHPLALRPTAPQGRQYRGEPGREDIYERMRRRMRRRVQQNQTDGEERK